MKVSDIAFECGKFWVGKQYEGKEYFWTVFENQITHAKSIGAAWDGDADGLSIAIAYAAYRAKVEMNAQESLGLAQDYYRGRRG